jgi:hypothetical protein
MAFWIFGHNMVDRGAREFVFGFQRRRVGGYEDENIMVIEKPASGNLFLYATL